MDVISMIKVAMCRHLTSAACLCKEKQLSWGLD